MMAVRANGIDIGLVNGDAVLVERTLPVFAVGLVIHAVVGGDTDSDILSLVRLQGGFEFGEIGFGIRLCRAVVRRINSNARFRVVLEQNQVGGGNVFRMAGRIGDDVGEVAVVDGDGNFAVHARQRLNRIGGGFRRRIALFGAAGDKAE